jgi:hypothetical protein
VVSLRVQDLDVESPFRGGGEDEGRLHIASPGRDLVTQLLHHVIAFRLAHPQNYGLRFCAPSRHKTCCEGLSAPEDQVVLLRGQAHPVRQALGALQVEAAHKGQPRMPGTAESQGMCSCWEIEVRGLMGATLACFPHTALEGGMQQKLPIQEQIC